MKTTPQFRLEKIMVKFCALVSVLALVLGGSANAANWAPQSVAAFGPDFVARNVFFVDSMTGWIVGGDVVDEIFLDGQKIWKTTDGGVNWVQQATGGGIINGVHFIDSNTGWVSGHNGTAKQTQWTTDGGATWNSVTHPGVVGYLFDIDATDASNVWAVGDQATVRHSTDGGQTWSNQTLPGMPPAIAVNAVDMLSSTIGYIGSGSGQIFKTTDGATWSEVYQSPAGVFALQFIDSQNGFAAKHEGGVGSHFMRTIDGGLNWSILDLPTFDAPFYPQIGHNGIYFADDQEGWALVLGHETPRVYHTTDAGDSWELQYIFENDIIAGAINFSDPETGWIVGENLLPPALMSAFGPSLFAEVPTSASFLLQFDPNAPGIEEFGNPAPEPGSIGLLSLGLLFLHRRRKYAPPGA